MRKHTLKVSGLALKKSKGYQGFKLSPAEEKLLRMWNKVGDILDSSFYINQSEYELIDLTRDAIRRLQASLASDLALSLALHNQLTKKDNKK